MRVIAAVTNYNCATSIVPLVRSLLNDSFDDIYVLDDASTDDSIDSLREFLDQITVIAGEVNLGPAGNRNRVIPALKEDDIVLFIDADMVVKQHDIAPVLKKIFTEKEHLGIVGGFIVDKHEKPMRYNYGVLTRQFGTRFGLALEMFASVLPKRTRRQLKPFARRFTFNLDITNGAPIEREVGWVAEGLCALKGSVFKELHGFDESLRYHEGQELAHRLHKANLLVLFSPTFRAMHLEAKVRKNRTMDSLKARRKYYQKVSTK